MASTQPHEAMTPEGKAGQCGSFKGSRQPSLCERTSFESLDPQKPHWRSDSQSVSELVLTSQYCGVATMQGTEEDDSCVCDVSSGTNRLRSEDQVSTLDPGG
jgi:hypothetical protein